MQWALLVPRKAPFVWRSSTIPALRGLLHVMTLNWKHSYHFLLMTSPLPHKRTTRRHASPSTFIRGSGCFLFTAADTLPVVFDSWHYVNRFLCYAISVGHLFSIPYARMPSKMAPYSYLDLWGASTAVSLRCTAHQGSSIASCAWSKHHAYRHTCLCSYPRRADGRRERRERWKGGV